jgi:hypothetical protein
MKHVKSLLLLLYASGGALLGQTTVINNPGPFVFGNDQVYSPTQDNDVAFEIAVDGVIFDMNGFSLAQAGNGFTGLIAILVDPGVNNTVIQNGTLMDITGTGIVVSAGCSNVSIQSVASSDIGESAVAFNGTLLSPISNVDVTDCEFSTSSTLIDSTTTALFQNCNNINIQNTQLIQNGNPSGLLDVALLLTCTKINISDSLVDSNVGIGLNGFHFNNCTQAQVLNTNSLDNQSSGTTINGFLVDNVSSGIIFNTCISQGNITTAGSTIEARGFAVLNSNICDFIQCQSRANQSTADNGTAMGFDVLNSTFININSCLITGNTAPTGNAFGIFWDTNSQSTIRGSFSQSNIGLNSSIGCHINNCSMYALISNQFLYNTTAITNRGLRVLGGTTRFATNNIAFENGTTQAEQYEGLQSNETQYYDTSTNSLTTNITNYWANAGAF